MRTGKIYAILLPFIIPALAYGNFVDNPSMESNFIYQDPLGDVAEYWTGWTEADGPYAGDFSQGSVAHNANKSQEIQWDGFGWEHFGPDGIYQQITSLQPGQTYRVSVWCKCNITTGGDSAYANIICSIGTDTNGGTNPDVVDNWVSVSEYAYGSSGESPWFRGMAVFSAYTSIATIFIKVSGDGDAEVWFEGPWPDSWNAFGYIDDVNVLPIQISPESTVSATTPIPANGVSYSEVIITVLDPNSEPIQGIPPSAIDVNCTGSGNFIVGPDTLTDENGQTTVCITSNVAETKTVSVTIFGMVLSNTATIHFCESHYSKLRASDGAANDDFGRSVAIDGNIALVGAYGDDVNGTDSGSAYIFRYNGSNWVEEAKLLPSDGAAGDYFGLSVSIDGNIAVVGANRDDDNGSSSGSAYIFRYNGSTWIQEAKLLASDGAASDKFGCSAIDVNIVIVGAYGDDDNGSNSGSAYVFRYNGSTWIQEAKLLASDGADSDYFGRSVAIDGNIAIVGAYWDDDKGYHSGSAYIFRFNGSTWIQEAKLLASDGAANDDFGESVAIDGNIAIAGAWGNDDNGSSSGSAYVFRYNGATWIQEEKLLASDGAAQDNFGTSVALDGNITIVGASGDDDNGYFQSGSAYIFRYNGSNWAQQDRLLASDGTHSDYFGGSVDINGNIALIGVASDDDNGSNSGSVYVFPALNGDFDGDGDVGLFDFSTLAYQWLQVPGQPSADAAPCGGDCVVDVLDLAVLCAHWLE
jgi:hypothetical protein